ncbi:MAG: 5-aminolevulinate synthase [Parvularculaceae bacterium]
MASVDYSNQKTEARAWSGEDYRKQIRDRIATIKAEGRYRVFAEIGRRAGRFPNADIFSEDGAHPITVWCSNDYLGMGQHPSVLNAMVEAAQTYGAGAGGTRNISGTSRPLVELERMLAQLHGKEAALVLTSGYIANEAAISSIANALPGCIIYSDAMNHASMIAGMRSGRSEKRIFRHNDVAHLTELLEADDPARPKLIAFESVYSMDGDISPIEEICDVADRFGAITYLDEVHAVGLYGAHGGGVSEERGLAHRLDIINGTLAKAYGVMGGYIAASAEIVDLVRCSASCFIFTTALPPAVAAAAHASVKHLTSSSAERERHQERAAAVKRSLSNAGLPVMPSETHIVPVLVGDPVICKKITDTLMSDYGIYIQPINYPTVPRGTERLRITPTPVHTDDMIEELTRALREVWKQYGLSLGAGNDN